MNERKAGAVELEFVEGESGARGYWRLVIRRPEKRNAIDELQASRLRRCIEGIEPARGLPLLTVCGEGPAFCAGADLDSLAVLDQRSAADFISNLHHALDALRRLDLISVALIQGACVGAGLELAASCDLRIARPDAWFSMPEVVVGVPSVIEAALLPRLIGWSACADLVLTGRRMAAAEALDRGLLREVTSADWAAVEQSMVTEVSALDAEAVRLQKRLLRVWEESFPSNAIHAGVEAFAESYRDEGRVRRRIAGLRR